jgi:thymidylate synthase (FAD)
MSTIINIKIPVLDKGYIRLVHQYGDCLTVVNAARASFEAEVTTMGLSDKGLLWYLARNEELAPFRHAMLHMEIRAPLMIARQWWKYRVGAEHTEPCEGAWSEASRRYVRDKVEFYEPAEWRSKPANSKQGSGVALHREDAMPWDLKLMDIQAHGEDTFNAAIESGVCAEQARGFLPSNFQYTTWRATHSLQSLAHLIKERDDSHAQWEFQQYAKPLRRLCAERFPDAWGAIERQARRRAKAFQLLAEWEAEHVQTP